MVNSISNNFENIASFEALFKGCRAARNGKRYNGETVRFTANLESNLVELSSDLRSGIYEPKGFKHFSICDPKEREIYAPYFRDRVVHRSFHLEVEPFLDKKFIYDSYACRKGKGTHAGVDRAQEFLAKGRNKYYLKCDIRKYFDSIDHEILMDMFSRYVRDQRTQKLVGKFLDSYHTEEGKGLPIGALYSQLFANLYLNGFDHFVKQTLEVKYYVRYMDDFVLFSDSKRELHGWRRAMQNYLDRKLKLDLPEDKITLEPTEKGLTFLGYRIFSNQKLVRKRNKKKFKTRLRKQKKALKNNEIAFSEVKDSIESWKGHASHADTADLKKKYIEKL
ncbi:MAG: reverse transcriptase/maturase family protein [Candidatus Nanohaloarchaea archaeon]